MYTTVLHRAGNDTFISDMPWGLFKQRNHFPEGETGFDTRIWEEESVSPCVLDISDDEQIKEENKEQAPESTVK